MQLFYCYITCYVFNTVLTCVTYGRLRHVTNVSYRPVPGVYFIQATGYELANLAVESSQHASAIYVKNLRNLYIMDSMQLFNCYITRYVTKSVRLILF